MGNFLDPVDRADVIEGVDGGGETSVEAEDLMQCDESMIDRSSKGSRSDKEGKGAPGSRSELSRVDSRRGR